MYRQLVVERNGEFSARFELSLVGVLLLGVIKSGWCTSVSLDSRESVTVGKLKVISTTVQVAQSNGCPWWYYQFYQFS